MSVDNDSYNFARQRAEMVKSQLKGRDITDEAVLEVIGRIGREEFVSDSYGSCAYSDNPLPIGMGQTISQPYIVALMTQYLRLNGGCEVLEVGTGSGYQTAILAELCKKVYTIERFGELSERAAAVLGRLGYDNIEFCVGDGSCGWYEEREFDRIIITAAVGAVPEPIEKSLKEGGIVVAPVGSSLWQELVVGEKIGGELKFRNICGCRFVKLIGEYGFGE